MQVYDSEAYSRLPNEAIVYSSCMVHAYTRVPYVYLAVSAVQAENSSEDNEEETDEADEEETGMETGTHADRYDVRCSMGQAVRHKWCAFAGWCRVCMCTSSHSCLASCQIDASTLRSCSSLTVVHFTLEYLVI